MTAQTATLSAQTQHELDKLVERVARKSGYIGQESLQTHFQRKFQAKAAKARRKIDKAKVKTGVAASETDFSEEIRSYLADGLLELINQGLSEAEALNITREKFDEAELTPSWDGFLQAFDDFGLNQIHADAVRVTQVWYGRNAETVGLFYGAFLILGLTGGALIGWLTGQTWQTSLIGLAAGLGFGVAAGLLSHAILTARRDRP